jgi:hypothetical protein
LSAALARAFRSRAQLVLLPAAWPESLSFRWGCRRYACQFGSGGDPQGGIRHTAVLAATFLQASDAIKFRALHRSVCCTRPALLSDLRIARMLRGTRPVQAFLALRKRPEFLFPAQVLFAGFRRPAHTGKAMVFRGHLIMVSSHASSLCPAGAGANGVGRLNGSTILRLTQKEVAHGSCLGALCIRENRHTRRTDIEDYTAQVSFPSVSAGVGAQKDALRA